DGHLMAHPLTTHFSPRSIAVVGASSNPRRIGGRAFANLAKEFEGTLYAVNRGSGDVQGTRAYPDLASLPEAPDLAVISVSSEQLLGTLEDAAATGVSSAVVLSSGFAETGP